MITISYFLFILIRLIEITSDRKERSMNKLRNSYIITMGNNHAILNKYATNISEEEKKIESYKNDNNIYHSKM